MKKHAWTLAELMVVFIVIGILAVVCVSNFKPNIQKTRVYIYAAIKNISSATMLVAQENEDSLEGPAPAEGETVVNDWFCSHFADNLNLTVAPNCKIPASGATDTLTVNVQFPNGVTIKGLANPWEEINDYKVKNILVDIDGDKGVNQLWVDRFPLRIYSGGDIYNGQVFVTNCADDFSGGGEYDHKSPFCTAGLATALDDNMITYDVYKPESADEVSTAILVKTNLAPMVADCGAYAGSGIYPIKQCSGKARIISRCVTTANCAACTNKPEDAEEGAAEASYNICPNVDKKGQSIVPSVATCTALIEDENPDEVSCFTLLHKPGAGMSFLLETLLTNIDE